MTEIPISMKKMEADLAKISDERESAAHFFSILSSQPLSTNCLVEMIDVKKYDEETKGFDLLHYYVSFERRRMALYNIEYIDELVNETYNDFLEEGNDPLSLDEYNFHKSEKIKSELVELILPVTQIIAGKGALLNEDDIDCARTGVLQIPIKTIDMKSIAFLNQRNGLFGGMPDENYNELISRIIHGEASGDDIGCLRDIPDGYGWPTIGLNQRVWAEIDVNTPDDILITAFKNWLIEVRKLPCLNEQGIPYHLFSEGNVKSSHLNKWFSLRVLAYLDLKIIASITNTKLTLKNYADIIYVDQYDIDTTEKVRKTLIPMVNEIMSEGYLNNLLKKALSEVK